MNWLNYHHLYYFHAVAHEGSIAAACAKLDVTQPTISAQVRALERSLKIKLFEKKGRGLVLTDAGRVVLRYADDIFSLGRELTDSVRGRSTGRASRLVVGVADAVPKLVAYRILEPALKLAAPVQVVCLEGKFQDLLANLSVHDLDLVLADCPLGPDVKVKAYNHPLGSCGLSIMGTPALAAAVRKGPPRSLDGAPFLLPTESTAVRRSLNHWFETQEIQPVVRGEFDDSALMAVFGQAGVGLFPVPSVIEDEVRRQHRVRVVARLRTVRERFYAISVERRLKHPAVVAISEGAQRTLFPK